MYNVYNPVVLCIMLILVYYLISFNLTPRSVRFLLLDNLQNFRVKILFQADVFADSASSSHFDEAVAGEGGWGGGFQEGGPD